MTRLQRRALEHPCFEAEETAHPRFAFSTRQGGLVWQFRLTLNIGLSSWRLGVLPRSLYAAGLNGEGDGKVTGTDE